MLQCVCCSYCRQLNALSFSTDTSCCTVQIHIQCADWVLFRYTAGTFSVLLSMWQCVCYSYCRQLNAVSFSTDTSCYNVQIHIQSADLVLFRYTAGIFSVLLWMWQCVCCSYCRQLNAVSFSTGTACCTVQIHYSVLTGSCWGILQGNLGALKNFGKRILGSSYLTARLSAWLTQKGFSWNIANLCFRNSFERTQVSW